MSVLDVLQDLVVGQALEGEAAEGDHLVEEDSDGPDVRHGGEEAVGQRLRGHPPDGQHPLPREPVVVALVHRTRHPKVGQLHGTR